MDAISTLNTLLEQGELNYAKVQQVLKVELQPSPDLSTESFNVFHADVLPKWLEKVEFRAPAKAREKAVGLLILTLKPDAGITRDIIVKKYGKGGALQVPTPRQPPETPIYEVYEFPWGKCSFGYKREKPDQLVDVVIDTIAAKK